MVLMICSKKFVEAGREYARGELVEITEDRLKKLDNQGHIVTAGNIFGRDYIAFLMKEYVPEYPNGEEKEVNYMYF